MTTWRRSRVFGSILFGRNDVLTRNGEQMADGKIKSQRCAVTLQCGGIGIPMSSNVVAILMSSKYSLVSPDIESDGP
jgi:hypothetical protein